MERARFGSAGQDARAGLTGETSAPTWDCAVTVTTNGISIANLIAQAMTGPAGG